MLLEMSREVLEEVLVGGQMVRGVGVLDQQRLACKHRLANAGKLDFRVESFELPESRTAGTDRQRDLLEVAHPREALRVRVLALQVQLTSTLSLLSSWCRRCCRRPVA